VPFHPARTGTGNGHRTDARPAQPRTSSRAQPRNQAVPPAATGTVTEEQGTRLAITREEVTRVLGEPPAADAGLQDGARAGRPGPGSPTGAVTVPPWQEGSDP